MSTVKVAGQSIKKLWKDGWIYMPEVMASHILSTIGIVGLGVMGLYYKNKTVITRSFDRPLFFRPDDPRAKKTVTYYEEGWDKK